MRTLKHTSLLVFAVIIGGVILSVGNGCSKSFSTDSASGDTGTGSSGSTATGGGGVSIIPGARTVSLVNANQVVDQLSSCVGVAKPSDKTLAMYDSKRGAISLSGSVETLTSPMMMAIASVAGEVCNDLIDQEVSGGARMFVGFDMTASALPSDIQIQNSISRIALSCWQQNETSTEKQLVLDMLNSVGATEAMASRKAALMICTAMLSSLKSITN